MAMAKWGDIKFSVNADEMFSFRDLKRSYSGRWAEHDRIGKRPLSEFQGAGLDELTFEAILDAEMGVRPRQMMYKMRVAAERGFAAYFYIKGKKIAVNKFVIVSGTENWKEIWKGGELVRSTAQITMREYVESPGAKKKSENKKKVKTKKAKNEKKKNVKGTEKKKKTVDQLAREVIQGKWGNGDERRKKLKAAGYDYGEVQKKVNETLR